jgi:hypothetical protein
MTHDAMYALSTALHELFRTSASSELLQFHAYRYKHFVDNSPRGAHCRYARATLVCYEQDQERTQLAEYLKNRWHGQHLELL